MDGKEFDAGTPRLVYRLVQWGSKTPTYRTVRLGDLRWVPAHDAEYHTLGDPRKRKVRRPDAVRVLTGSVHDIAPPDRLAEYVRRPTARALARIEAAEAAIQAANAELKAARRAAFTHGRPVPLSTVKRTDRERRAATGG